MPSTYFYESKEILMTQRISRKGSGSLTMTPPTEESRDEQKSLYIRDGTYPEQSYSAMAKFVVSTLSVCSS